MSKYINRKSRRINNSRSVICDGLTFVAFFIILPLLAYSIVNGMWEIRAKANLVSALPEGVVYASTVDAGTSEIGQVATPEGELIPSPSQPIIEYSVNSKNEIEILVHSYFGSDADIALAIMKAESGGKADALYRWGDEARPHRGECSVGLFQINLRSNDCKGKLVHWDKAEGETLEEKIAWLQVPENNIKVAYQIYKAQGFTPWSTFNNGSYGKFLER